MKYPIVNLNNIHTGTAHPGQKGRHSIMTTFETAIRLAKGETVQRKDIKSFKDLILELDCIIENCTTSKRQLRKAVRDKS